VRSNFDNCVWFSCAVQTMVEHFLSQLRRDCRLENPIIQNMLYVKISSVAELVLNRNGIKMVHKVRLESQFPFGNLFPANKCRSLRGEAKKELRPMNRA
jgi:hypothetical protein